LERSGQKAGREFLKEVWEFREERMLLLLISVGAVPEWEDGNYLRTEVEQKQRFESQSESGAASIWKSFRRPIGFLSRKEQ
jgi:hypothetical protein